VRSGALAEAIRPPLATALGISVASHLAVYALTPVLSLHLVALGGTSAQVGILFAVFSVVAVVLRPAAGLWIDRQGIRWALLPGAGLMAVSSLGLQAATEPAALIGVMAVFGVGYGLATMAAAVLAASAPAERRGRALGAYYLAGPVSMAVAAPLGLGLFRGLGPGATFAMVTALGVAAAAFGFSANAAARPRATPPETAGTRPRTPVGCR
jgi:MFS family permease